MTEAKPFQSGETVAVYDETYSKNIGIVQFDGRKLVWRDCLKDFPEEDKKKIVGHCYSGRDKVGFGGHIYALRRIQYVE